MTADLVNGLYELLGCVAIGASIISTAKHKKTRGISLITVFFFTSWGYWNLFYYPHLGQTLSAIGALLTCFANSVWLYLIVKYRNG